MALVSIIIVNYNWKKWLKKCFDSIFNQTYKNYEIIFIDNKSDDDSIEFVQKEYPLVKIIKSNKNWWFSYGNNLWIAQSNWELLRLLNNDTRFENNFLEIYIKEYQKLWLDILWVKEIGYNWEKSKYYPTTIDYFWHPVPWKDRADKQVFYTQWSCVLCTKRLYQDTWWLDEDFFMYCEEVDWMRRARMMWYIIGQIDSISIHHAWWGSSSWWLNYKTFLWRNQNTLQMLLKNHTILNLIWVLPIYLLFNISEMIIFTLIWRYEIVRSYLEWRKYNYINLFKIISKRKKNKIRSIPLMYFWIGKILHLFNYLK